MTLPPPLAVPLDKEGYCVSLSAEDGEAVRAFLHEYGFVVVRDVLSDEECMATLSELWASGSGEASIQSPPESFWDSFFWELQPHGKFGITSFGGLESLMQLKNRQNPRVVAAWRAVHGCRRLWCDHDRIGVMRPTVGVDVGDGKGPLDRPEWRTMRNWLHLDANPTVCGETGYASIGGFKDDGTPIDFASTFVSQGLLTLTDARAEDGGFHCVPGSHRYAMRWSAVENALGDEEACRRRSRKNHRVGDADPLMARIAEVPVRRGCLLAWSSLLFHGNRPNRSERFRAVQYMRTMPASAEGEPRSLPYTPLHSDPAAYPDEGFDVTPLGARLFGFLPWEEKNIADEALIGTSTHRNCERGATFRPLP